MDLSKILGTKAISDFTPLLSSNIETDDIIPIVHNGVNRTITIDDLSEYTLNSSNGIDLTSYQLKLLSSITIDYYQTSQPSSANENEYWYDSSNNKLYQYITDTNSDLSWSEISLDNSVIYIFGNSRYLYNGETLILISTYEDATYTNSEETPVTIGGIEEGSTFEGKTMQEMWDALLYPTLYPTLTNPSMTYSCGVSGYHIIGDTVTISNTYTFNRGSINPQYTATSAYRSGELSTVTYTIANGSNIVISGTNICTCTIGYLVGVQPKDSKGNDYDSPLSAGNLSKSVYFYGTLPIYATTESIDTLTQQTLQAIESDAIINLVAEDDSNKQIIKIASDYGKVNTIYQYNTLSNSWDSIDTGTFTVTTETITLNSVDYTYNIYTYNGSKIGARKLKFTF